MTKDSKNGAAVFSVISLIAVIGFASIPGSVHAGVLSDALLSFSNTVSAWSGNKTAKTNVQTMTLPYPATNIDPNPSVGGGDITIVDDSALLAEDGPTGTVSKDEPQSHQISIYVVRKGDTLSGIADMFNVSMNTIRWSNDIGKNGTIQPGQTLTILPVTGVKYTVKKGDTVASIAKKYNGDADEILNFNGLEGGVALTTGSEIIIPNGEIAVAPVIKTTVKTSTKVTVGAEPAHDTNGPSYSGYYNAPLSHYIETQGIHGYNAVDLAAPIGTPVMASAEGDVIVARASGWNGGYGTYVVISHDNGTQTLYAHMSKILVSVGQHVSQGEVIGAVGVTGLTTGPHVHFEIRGAKNPF